MLAYRTLVGKCIKIQFIANYLQGGATSSTDFRIK